MNKSKSSKTLIERYPPSRSCSCEICLGYCKRPGWWTVHEATKVINAGYANRMMLEIAPELTFGVLSPAFKGNESSIALNLYSRNSCNFLNHNLCELYSTGLMPLECRFCHHNRPGQGNICHLDIEKDWNTPMGQALVQRWIFIVKL
jgi:hypothetical protein